MTVPPPEIVPAPGTTRRRRRWGILAGALVATLGIGVYAVVGGQSSGASAVAVRAPNGTFVTASGSTVAIDSLWGRPTLVWFVAGGCASCAASIPAVAAHLGQLARDGVQVLTLGLYGDFRNGHNGVVELLGFGRAAAGGSITRADWTWGMASAALSQAYDPSGTPDVYALIGPGGHIRYRNAVPVSTMPQLLAAAARLTGHPVPAESPAAPSATASTLP